MNYQQLLKEGTNFLKTGNIVKPEFDCELLLSKALNKKREEILINLRNKINKKQLDKFIFYLSRRKKREPVAYILGYKYFWKFKFFVNKSVLVPRPETEIIVEQALDYISDNSKAKKIWLTHGRADALEYWCKKNNINAKALYLKRND